MHPDRLTASLCYADASRFENAIVGTSAEAELLQGQLHEFLALAVEAAGAANQRGVSFPQNESTHNRIFDGDSTSSSRCICLMEAI